MPQEPLDYKIEVETNDCIFKILINGIPIAKSYKAGPFYALVGIGEYLTPSNNTIEIVTRSATGNGRSYTPGSYCKAVIKGRKREATEKLNTITGINFTPSDDSKFNTTSDVFTKISNTNPAYGKSIAPPAVQYDAKKKLYVLTRPFSVSDNFSQWKWTYAKKLSDKNYTQHPLPVSQRDALIVAYQNFWQAINKKDWNKIKKLRHEFSLESAIASGCSQEYYSNSSALKFLIDDPNFVLQPLNLKDLRYSYSLNGKTVTLKDKEGSIIRFKRKDKPNGGYIYLTPRFRAEGDNFVIAR